MNGYAFEAEQQPDGTYIMSISGKSYRCRDWKDVCDRFHKLTEGDSNAREEQNRCCTPCTQTVHS